MRRMKKKTLPADSPRPPLRACGQCMPGVIGGARTHAAQKPDPEKLAQLYRKGMTLRAIGEEIGRTHGAVRYQLRKLKGYRRMITALLLKRVRKASAAFSVTRTRENRRRMKHALAMLRQKRPALYARMMEKGLPVGATAAQKFGKEYRAPCPHCATGTALARRIDRHSWQWRCYTCCAEWIAGERK